MINGSVNQGGKTFKITRVAAPEYVEQRHVTEGGIDRGAGVAVPPVGQVGHACHTVQDGRFPHPSLASFLRAWPRAGAPS